MLNEPNTTPSSTANYILFNKSNQRIYTKYFVLLLLILLLFLLLIKEDNKLMLLQL